jgi:hypothetical protein
MSELHKFWFKFEPIPLPSAINVGCGVTAYDLNDALQMLRDYVFGHNGPPSIVQCIEDVEMREIEQNHAYPNIGDTERRGIWFPQGYYPQL